MKLNRIQLATMNTAAPAAVAVPLHTEHVAVAEVHHLVMACAPAAMNAERTS